MPVTVLYPEARQQPDDLEREVFGADVRILKRDASALSELSEADCAEADGLMIMGFPVTGADLARFPRLRAVVRMGVGYDKLDRPAAAARNVLVCNVPDYGTTEVADHAIALALTLRRGILLHHELQRNDPPAPFRSFQHPLIQRLGMQTFGIVGLGRIGTAVALRAKAFNFRVVFFDPYLPNGVELSLGINRAPSLEDLLRQTDTLSIHAPLTPETSGMLGREQLALLKPGAVVVNDARGPIVDLDALAELLRSGHIAGAGLDVLPVEPPVEPDPRAVARLPRPREVARRAPRDHAAFGLADAAFGARHAAQIGRDDARGATDQPAAERHHAGDVLAYRVGSPTALGAPMHRLHLLRHAKSGQDDAADDHARRLSRRGRDDARRIGEGLPGALGGLDLVLCSTALRTRETAMLVLGDYAAPPRIAFEEVLYLASAAALLQRLRRLDESDGAVLVIGHNPGLHDLALALAAPGSPRYQGLASGKFPTTARASVAVATPWAALDQGRHALIDYVTPKSLADQG